MTYIEGFVLAVPEGNKQAFVDHASDAFPLFEEYGVTRHAECWEADVPDGKLTDFRRAVKAEAGEKIVFSWLEYPSKAVRDSAHEKMMADPRMEEMSEMPFDGMRMIYGGFDVIADRGTGQKSAYVSGSLFAVPNDRKSDFTAFCEHMGGLFMDHGAGRVVDSWGTDVPEGKVTDFQRAVALKDGESVAFTWIEWPSKEASDKAWEKLMEDPRMQEVEMPCDGKRMVFGGFEPVVNLFAKAGAKA
ncbi:MAG: DUF1428 domain-containing protein [Henriciella sp.]